MRFFFDIIEGGCQIGDTEGIDLIDDGAAQSEALAIVSDLCREFPDRFQQGAVLEVYSEHRRRVIAVPIRPPVCNSLSCQPDRTIEGGITR